MLGENGSSDRGEDDRLSRFVCLGQAGIGELALALPTEGVYERMHRVARDQDGVGALQAALLLGLREVGQQDGAAGFGVLRGVDGYHGVWCGRAGQV